MRVAIIDDDAEQRSTLVEYVERYSKEKSIIIECKCFTSGLDFVSEYNNPYDIILLDIEMPQMDGLQTAKDIRAVDQHAAIIFITHMAQYAIKGYEVDAMDFMVKPVGYFNFSLKLTKAIKHVKSNAKFSVTSDRTTIVLSEDDIYYIEGLNQYIIYHTAGEDYKVHATLKAAEARLSSHFSRCNNSFIVNLQYVTKIDNTEVCVGQYRLPISRGRKKEFMDDLNKFLGGI
jgi:DNA-binding LytR/AlgR family response regulator